MQKYSQSLKLMGNNFTITVVADEKDCAYKNINLAEFDDFKIWGVVIHSIHSFEKLAQP